jgi:hypothetical protein
MTLQELKQGIDQSTPEERLFLAAYLKHVARKDDPAYRLELSRLRDEMNTGQKYTLEQVKRIHQALEAEGF